MPTIPAPVDTDGNITLPRAGAVVIPVRMQQADGTPIDASALTLRFVAGARLNKLLTDDPSFPGGKLLTIEESEADAFSSHWLSFSVLDETNDPAVEIWPGKIRRGDQ